MRKIGIKELFEAMHPSQLTGAYQVMVSSNDVDYIEWPVFYKNEGVLVADIVEGKNTVSRAPHATVYVFGTRNPYEKLRSFMNTHYGIELDEHDFGVGILMDDRGTLPPNSLPDIKEVHARMREAMAKAHVV